MSYRSVYQTISWIRKRSKNGPRTAEGICKISVEAAYNIASDGTSTAAAGWLDTIARIPGFGYAKQRGHRWWPGAFDWWTGGSHGAGHVTIRSFRRGYVWSKDILRPGMWDRVPIEVIEQTWTRLRYAGASRDISRVILVSRPTPPSTALKMYDSITVRDIPGGAQAVAGYVNGKWPTWGELIARWHLPAVSIAVNANGRAQCLDVERGDATVSDVGPWLDRLHRDHPHVMPILYTSASQVAAVRAAAGSRPVLIWSAHYTGKAHLCAPNVCGYPHADATQYADKGPKGEHIDVSLLTPRFMSEIAHR